MADAERVIEIKVDTQKAVKGIDRLNEELDRNTRELNQNQEEVKQSTAAQKKYKKQLDDSSDGVSSFTDEVDNMSGGLFGSVKAIGQSVKALKTLKGALAATGIGAIALAVGTLISAFQRLQGPMNVLSDVTAGIGAAFDAALQSLNIFGTAFLLFIEGNYAAAIGVASTAINNITEAYKEGTTLNADQREFEKWEAQRMVRLSEMESQIEDLKLISEDQSKSDVERQEAATKALELQQGRVAGLIEIENKRVDLARRLYEQTKRDEDYIAFLNAQQEANENIATLKGQIVELNNANVALEKEITDKANQQWETEKERNKLRTSEAAFLKKSRDQTIKQAQDNLGITKEANDAFIQGIDARIKATAEANKNTEEGTEDQKELNEALAITTTTAEGLLDVFSGKVKGKDIFKTVLRTIGNILSVVSGTNLTGLTGLVGGLFADGGMLKGPSHKDGGIWVNAEGGEGIINKRSMSIPWVRQLASDLNQIGGGVKFEDGGIVPTLTAQEAQLQTINQSLQEQRIVLPIPDLTTEATKVQAVEDRATL